MNLGVKRRKRSQKRIKQLSNVAGRPRDTQTEKMAFENPVLAFETAKLQRRILTTGDAHKYSN